MYCFNVIVRCYLITLYTKMFSKVYAPDIMSNRYVVVLPSNRIYLAPTIGSNVQKWVFLLLFLWRVIIHLVIVVYKKKKKKVEFQNSIIF